MYVLDDNIQAKVLAFAFGLVAEIERDLISQRTREALAARRASGLPVGRHLGSVNRAHKLDGLGDCIDAMLRAGYSRRKTVGRYLR